MRKVLLLGATGMLGNSVYDCLKDSYALTLAVRDPKKITLLEKAYGGTNKHRITELDAARIQDEKDYYESFLKEVGDIDYVINAIGITQPFAEKNPSLTFFINGELPHILSRTFGRKLIHITTDGVFDGKHGPYDERSPKSPVGTYAESKSRGEPVESLTLRTSIIGRELESGTGLLEWFLLQKGKTIHGFTHHLWNGITAQEFGNVCDRIMSAPEKFPRSGIYHIFSDTVSKYEMLLAFKQKYAIDCEIIPESGHQLNRTLSTIYDFNNKLAIPSFEKMLAELN